MQVLFEEQKTLEHKTSHQKNAVEYGKARCVCWRGACWCGVCVGAVCVLARCVCWRGAWLPLLGRSPAAAQLLVSHVLRLQKMRNAFYWMLVHVKVKCGK